ncbi:hypothetical protein XELAEV_18013346mg [Xenopus laevis]|uniref:Uncharacterized protein n=1 Tax=Xenopus laevis TaxID=8355 RepID=A0A974HZ97_XENLA|nr:hypothetical protein XELAEV_18013346mg [Xenopus laevis]
MEVAALTLEEAVVVEAVEGAENQCGLQRWSLLIIRLAGRINGSCGSGGFFQSSVTVRHPPPPPHHCCLHYLKSCCTIDGNGSLDPARSGGSGGGSGSRGSMSAAATAASHHQTGRADRWQLQHRWPLPIISDWPLPPPPPLPAPPLPPLLKVLLHYRSKWQP